MLNLTRFFLILFGFLLLLLFLDHRSRGILRVVLVAVLVTVLVLVHALVQLVLVAVRLLLVRDSRGTPSTHMMIDDYNIIVHWVWIWIWIWIWIFAKKVSLFSQKILQGACVGAARQFLVS
jgi:hypothetical protein